MDNKEVMQRLAEGYRKRKMLNDINRKRYVVIPHTAYEVVDLDTSVVMHEYLARGKARAIAFVLNDWEDAIHEDKERSKT